MCSTRVSSSGLLKKHGQIHQIESQGPVSIMRSALNLLSISVTLSYFKIHVFIYIHVLFLTRLEKIFVSYTQWKIYIEIRSYLKRLTVNSYQSVGQNSNMLQRMPQPPPTHLEHMSSPLVFS